MHKLSKITIYKIGANLNSKTKFLLLIFSSFALAIFLYTYFRTSDTDPSLLVCAIMIKNEAPVICETLEPLIKSGIQSFLVFDTGSTDNTIETVKNCFQVNKITNYVIKQEPFIDFSQSRNRALDLVDTFFPDATFVIMPDAEWKLCNGAELIKFCQQHKFDQHSSYLINLLMNEKLEFVVDRLMRKSAHARFKAPVHEYLESLKPGRVPSHIFFKFNPTRFGAEKSRKRFERDLALLLKDHEREPSNPRTVFYLAQTYACLQNKDLAIKFYQLRTNMTGGPEENYIAMYRLAQLIDESSQHDKNHSWQEAENLYLKAYSMRPIRIAPLLAIARHYMAAKEYAIALIYAYRTKDISYPEQEILFVEKEAFMIERFDIIAECSFQTGDFKLGQWALQKALENFPHDKRLQENLKLFQAPHRSDLTNIQNIKNVETRNNVLLIKNQPVAVRDCRSSGFFAEFLWVLNHIHWCIKNNYIPYVYWGPIFAYYCPTGYNNSHNAWEYYFKQTSNIRLPQTEGPFHRELCYEKDFTTIWEYNQYICNLRLLAPINNPLCKIINTHPEIQFKDNPQYPVPFGNTHLYNLQFRRFVKDHLIEPYIQIQPCIQTKIDNFFLQNIAGKKTIGIHLRGKFISNEVLTVPVEKICQEANLFAAQGYQFFIATDQYPLLEQAKKLLKGKVIYYKYPKAEYTTSPFKSQQLNPQDGEDVLIEALLLSKCDYLIHTLSQVSTTILYFNPDLPHTVLY